MLERKDGKKNKKEDIAVTRTREKIFFEFFKYPNFSIQILK